MLKIHKQFNDNSKMKVPHNYIDIKREKRKKKHFKNVSQSDENFSTSTQFIVQ